MSLSPTDLLAQTVTAVQIETTLSPPVVIRDPFKASSEQTRGGLAAFLRPKITVELASGRVAPTVIAPYGEPGKLWIAAAVVVAVGLLGAAVWIAKRTK